MPVVYTSVSNLIIIAFAILRRSILAQPNKLPSQFHVAFAPAEQAVYLGLRGMLVAHVSSEHILAMILHPAYRALDPL